ncbi:MAG: sodium transporter, partial [Bacteroidota bacterium]
PPVETSPFLCIGSRAGQGQVFELITATLNIAAGVFTNDIYRHFFPRSSNKRTMYVARGATALFGILTIIVALLVPSMGGIVDVVLTVGALTGGALYLPPIWALFSKRQTQVSVLTATLVSLTINATIKFLGLEVGISLSRAQEMTAGVALPIVVLIVYEVYYAILSQEDAAHHALFQSSTAEVTEKTNLAADNDNLQGIRVIALGVLAVGTLIIILGLIADFAKLLVAGTGLAVFALGAALMVKVITTKKTLTEKKYDTRKVY